MSKKNPQLVVAEMMHSVGKMELSKTSLKTMLRTRTNAGQQER